MCKIQSALNALAFEGSLDTQHHLREGDVPLTGRSQCGFFLKRQRERESAALQAVYQVTDLKTN